MLDQPGKDIVNIWKRYARSYINIRLLFSEGKKRRSFWMTRPSLLRENDVIVHLINERWLVSVTSIDVENNVTCTLTLWVCFLIIIIIINYFFWQWFEKVKNKLITKTKCKYKEWFLFWCSSCRLDVHARDGKSIKRAS